MKILFYTVLVSLISNSISAQDLDLLYPHDLQAARDPRASEVFRQTCMQVPPTQSIRLPTDEEDSGPANYFISEIPNVIAAGQTWQLVWEESGHNADGIVAVDDGILVAQNSWGIIVKVGFDGSESYPYPDTRTGGSLSMNVAGELFVVERGLYPAITQIAPIKRELANRYNGEPLHCLDSVLNDLVADRHGGVYFTQGGLFYADPAGNITQYGENLRTNGIILSTDEKVLYVTNQGLLMAFDVLPDGELTNQRIHAQLPEGSRGDGLAIDNEDRIYVTAFEDGVHVISKAGAFLGTIAVPRRVISAAFGGPEKSFLFLVGVTPRQGYSVELLSVQMLSQGFSGRAK